MSQVAKITKALNWRWTRHKNAAPEDTEIATPHHLSRHSQNSTDLVALDNLPNTLSLPATLNNQEHSKHGGSKQPQHYHHPLSLSTPAVIPAPPQVTSRKPEQEQSNRTFLDESWTQKMLLRLRLLSPFSKKRAASTHRFSFNSTISRRKISKLAHPHQANSISQLGQANETQRKFSSEKDYEYGDAVDLLPFYDPTKLEDPLPRIVFIAGPEHFYHLALQLETSPRIEYQTHSKDLFIRAAGLGYAPAQFKLGICFELGLTQFSMDPSQSFAWYERAALQGHADAELAVSGWYLTGHPQGLEQSEPLAYEWASKAALRGWSKAEYTLGHYHEVGIGVQQDLSIAKQWYIKAAARGNERALLRLLVGQVGLEVDYAHLKDALLAQNGTNPYMIHQLAQFHELREYGLVPDEDAALELYMASAQASYAPAQYKLGACYEFGILGCPQDPVQAVHWYGLGADSGHVEALLALAGFFLDGSAGQAAAQSDEEAFRFVRAAAQRGVPKAEYITGFFLEYGLGVDRDTREAMKWYRLACAKGVDSAERRLKELERSAGATSSLTPVYSAS
ncbi:hypothetical protein BGZ83_009250 [Gryganskiella cystojenkinii]|nr:hypothetical protein BGZ83_009250 [Gryganskiella cystojenkinii]